MMGDMETPKTSTSKFFRGTHSSSDAPDLMEPDHVMMERFQAVLKDHLVRQKEKLDEQIRSMTSDLMKTKKEEDDVGTRLFSMKQEVAMHQKALENRQQQMDRLNDEKMILRETLKELRQQVKEDRRIYQIEAHKENELKIEVDGLYNWERQITAWKEEMDQNLAVNQRISEKTQADRKVMLEEKRKLDMYIFRLTSEVNKLESELTLINSELEGKEKECDLLNQTLADANADLQALSCDQKRLLNDWNTVVVAMSKRDDTYNQVVKELSSSQEAFRNLNAEIESYKRSSEIEMTRNEEFTIRLNSAQRDLDHHSRRLKVLLERKLDLEHKLVQHTDLSIQADKDLQTAAMQSESKQAELQNLQKDVDDLCKEKLRLEDLSLDNLLEQSSTNNAAMNLNKTVRAMRQKARDSEIGIAELENKLSKQLLEIEKLKGDIGRNEDILVEMNRDLDSKQVELERVKADTREIYSLHSNQTGATIILNNKIEELTLLRSKKVESPLQSQIQNLEWKIEEMKKENSNLQTQWLVKQNSTVKLSQQKSEQLREISMLRKQVVLLDQKQHKTLQELENEQRVEAELQRNIMKMQQRLTTLSATLVDRTGHREHADKDLLLAQIAFIKSLEDSEKEQMKIKSQIQELDHQLEDLNDVMLATQREILAWEKKITIAKDTKQEIQKEKSDTGDIGQMRKEIHCMEVRFGQLKKVQEKLVCDLEQCVHRRETIVDEAEAREKRGKGISNSRANFQRKFEELKRKYKQAKIELKSINKMITEMQAGQDQKINELNEKTEHLKKLQKTSKRMEVQLENGQLRKQQNLEMLVRRQRKCKLLGLVKAGKYHPLYRNDLALDSELGAAKTLNANLTSILEALIADFPGHRFAFTKILNTLKPDSV